MNSDQPTPLLTNWERFFDPGTQSKGRDYFEQGRVVSLSLQPSVRPRSEWLITGSVLGSSARVYAVACTGRSSARAVVQLQGSCSCPVTIQCKHVAALLWAAVAAQAGAPATPASLSREAAEWVKQMTAARAQATDAASRKRATESPERLVYVLSVDPAGRPRLARLQCFKVRALKRGGYNAGQLYYLHNLVNDGNPPRFATPADIQIARVADGAGFFNQYYSTELKLGPQHSEELLRLVVQTGRCHWEKADQPPVTVGEVRVAQPEWEVTPSGKLHPTCVANPPLTAVIPVQPPWYYDAPSNACGPLDLGLPPTVAALWLGAPGFAPNDVNGVRAALAAPGDSAAVLPLPRAVTVEEVTDCLPVPVLQLATRMVQWWEVGVTFRQTGAQGKPCHFAKLHFDYRGLLADWGDQTPVLERGGTESILRISRHATEERRHLDRLTALGLGSAVEVMYSANQDWARTALVMAELDENLWQTFMLEHVPALQAEGWRIEYDPSFTGRVVEPDDWYADLEPEGGNDWFGLELGILVGGKKQNLLPVLLQALRDQTLSAEEVRAAGKQKRINVRLPDGTTLPFPAGRLRDILGVLVELFEPSALDGQNRLRLNRARASQLGALTEAQWKWQGGEALRELGRKLGGVGELKPIAPPAGLQATLRPYQLEGVGWLQFLREYELAGVLADDMGLGKTIQALAHLLLEKENGRMDRPCLVVAPTSLMVNWTDESARFAPALKVLTLHGDERKHHFERLTDYDLVLSTYPLLLHDEAVLTATDWHLVILDEAQNIKNPRTQYARVACALKTRHRLCLTGTPMENHLGELWSLFHFLLPGFLSDETRFRKNFRNPIEKHNDHERRDVLSRRVAPFILRRRKEQVAAELPPKTVVLSQVEIVGAQRDLYESIRLAMHEKVRAEVDRKGMARSQIVILDALLKLRQVCCDPRLLKLESARKIGQSAKLELLLDLLPEMLAEGRRILLFSQFTSMLELIEEKLADVEVEGRKLDWVKLTGDTTDRATPVQRFQALEVPLFLISLKAGGTGLNLTAADTVIHYDPWWNPAVENQATDRAHRIGQDKKVFVYKLITKGTVEEKILGMQERKRELVDGLLNTERKAGAKLSASDLDFLFAPLA